MLSLLNKIVKSGIRPTQDPLVVQRIRLVNSLNLAIQIFTFFLVVVVIFYGLYPQILLGSLIIFFLSITYWLNKKGYNSLSAYYLVNLTSIGVLVASYEAYNTSIFAETENWLFALLAISVFLFDRTPMVIQILIIFTEVCVAKFVKYQMFGLPMGRDFTLLIINSVVLSLGLYLILFLVKKGLINALNKLQERDKAKTKLLSLLAHDLRNPLSTFESLLDIGVGDQLSQKEFTSIQKGIKNRFSPVKESIYGVLDWSMSQLKNSEPVTKTFQLKDIVQNIRDAMTPFSEEKNIKIRVKGDSSMVTIDEEHLCIVVRNMLHNAVKFSPSGGEVIVDWTSNGVYVELCVLDHGVGLSKAQIDDIIEGRITDSKKGTEGEKGTGLGLNLSIELLRKNGGTMDIESSKDETIFSVKVPK